MIQQGAFETAVLFCRPKRLLQGEFALWQREGLPGTALFQLWADASLSELFSPPGNEGNNLGVYKKIYLKHRAQNNVDI